MDFCISDLHRLGEILSKSSQINLAESHQFNVLDDMNISEVGVESDSGESVLTQVGILDPVPIKFASIENGDIVELSAVGSDFLLWIRATKYDEQYERMLSAH